MVSDFGDKLVGKVVIEQSPEVRQAEDVDKKWD